MAPVHAVAFAYIKPGKTDEFAALLNGMSEKVHALEPGIRNYYNFKVPDEDMFVIVESYEDEAALQYHGETPHYHEYLEKAMQLFAKPLSFKINVKIPENLIPDWSSLQ
ncbi:hypothetical protein BGW36DRAFT_427476 [Talaromyces proteolyticus]|uniref:ABM domain-containing protein n=1 Tax=Talaromyces proteolyticus TaxID=1131652 RepID=A0AAD4Q0S7_9EURO|nr:uncharacterized protein BGW36DRAFT_427476 [Talaromyces proteolyticus]KAH8697518.1 hypothetical protein BGW36DRAFT_427476 [Talaromyces proteolyticus]